MTHGIVVASIFYAFYCLTPPPSTAVYKHIGDRPHQSRGWAELATSAATTWYVFPSDQFLSPASLSRPKGDGPPQEGVSNANVNTQRTQRGRLPSRSLGLGEISLESSSPSPPLPQTPWPFPPFAFLAAWRDHPRFSASLRLCASARVIFSELSSLRHADMLSDGVSRP